jgi:hypothetical protein
VDTAFLKATPHAPVGTGRESLSGPLSG